MAAYGNQGHDGDKLAATRARLEALMSAPDQVLESGMLNTMLEYIQAGGPPQMVVELLSENYKGYGQMASVVCGWLKLMQEEGGTGAAAAAPAATTSGSTAAAAGETLDEFHFLQEFVQAKFDPDKFQGIFSKNGSGRPPEWLDGLIALPPGRRLIYDLSAEHRNCLLLNFAITKILYQGHEEEVAAVGSSLASYFSVFHRLLAARLRAVAAATSASAQLPPWTGNSSSMALRRSPPPGSSSGGSVHDPAAAVAGLARELRDSTTLSQHTYLHTQQLLVELASHPHEGGAVFRRLSQELELHAAREHPAVWSMMPMFVSPHAPAVDGEVATLVGRLCAAAPKLSGVDVVRLSRLYTAPHGPRPPLVYLRHPQLLHLLVSSMFVPGKALSGDMLESSVSLLSLAASGQDSEEGDEGDMEFEGAGDAVLCCRQALIDALELAAHVQSGSKLTNSVWETAVRVTETPVAALGLLHFARMTLSSREYYHEAAAAAAAPGFLRVSLLIARTHPDLVEQVVSVIEGAVMALGSQRLELSRLFIDAYVALLRDTGAVAALMGSVENWCAAIDPSLVRHFIFQVLTVLSPPYSPTFAGWLLKLSVRSGVRRGRDGPRGSRNADLLESFAAECAATAARSQLHLSAKELTFLQELMNKNVNPT